LASVWDGGQRSTVFVNQNTEVIVICFFDGDGIGEGFDLYLRGTGVAGYGRNLLLAPFWYLFMTYFCLSTFTISLPTEVAFDLVDAQ